MSRINLLPREVAERRAVRRQGFLLVILGLVWLLLLGSVWFVRNNTLQQRQEELADLEGRIASLQEEVDALQEFALLDQRIKNKEQALATAMINDVAWARILLELSMTVPGDAWLTSFSGAATGPAEPTPGTGAGGPRFGNLNFSAVTFDFPGVARWLTRLGEMQELQSIWVPSASKGEIAGREVVNFSSTADLSGDALSHRFEGGVQ